MIQAAFGALPLRRNRHPLHWRPIAADVLGPIKEPRAVFAHFGLAADGLRETGSDNMKESWIGRRGLIYPRVDENSPPIQLRSHVI